MAEIRVPKLGQSQTRIKNVPIAVTPEGFWCCPSPPVFQKTLKPQNPQNKPKSISQTLNPPLPKNPPKQPKTTSSRAASLAPAENITRGGGSDAPVVYLNDNPPPAVAPAREAAPRKVSIEFGEAGTSDLKVILLGKQGVVVKLSVHRNVLAEHSRVFAGKILDGQLVFPCIEIDKCEDVEMYVEAIGLMYCKEPKHQLIKQSVDRVLRILKVGEQLGYSTCIQACLEYLEAIPWVGEEEEKVVSSVQHLEGSGVGVGSVLKRVISEASNPPKDTLAQILELVLQSKEEKGRREMKSIVLKLLRENNGLPTSSDLDNATLYVSCRTSLESLLSLFRQAVAEPNSAEKHTNNSGSLAKMISLEADNLLWLLDILADQQTAEEFAVMWVSQGELAELHARLPMVARHHVSMVTARLFVGIGRGEVLPSKDTRHLLLKRWLQPLMDDYSWLQHACRSFDRKVVEEGIGRTVLTLPLEDQQTVLLSWLGSFLNAGDNCPNLLKAFEVWWRRTFVRPYGESGGLQQPDGLVTPKDDEQ